jgi:hypothetical protein
MPDRTIVTRYDPPPIGARQFDWVATRDGYDLGDPIGYGRTEQEAVADLKSQLEDLRDDGPLIDPDECDGVRFVRTLAEMI